VVRKQKRRTLSRMSSALLAQTNGRGSALVASIVGNTPRLIWRRASRAIQPSTRFSQDAEVGVKCRW
jgi:hypothetical protein